MNESYDKELKSTTVQFNEIGDFVKGTLIEVTKMSRPDKWGKINNIYKVIADEAKYLGTTKNPKTGKFVVDKEPTVITAGTEVVFFASGVLAGQMKSIKLGQKFMVKFTETKPSDKGQDAKIKKVFPGLDAKGQPVFNQFWLDQNKKVAGPIYAEDDTISKEMDEQE